MQTIYKNIILLYALLTYGPLAADSQSTDSLLVHFSSNQSAPDQFDDSLIDRYFTASKLRRYMVNISLAGYCDNTGSDKYNDRLSRDRVLAVKNYLFGKWVNPDQIGAVSWYGKRFPLNNNSTRDERAFNRRVKILIRVSDVVTDTHPIAEDSPSGTHPVTETPFPGRAARDSAEMAWPDNGSLYEKLGNTNMQVGDTIILHYIVFEGGRHFPLPFSLPYLEELRKAMQDHPRLKIHISGYVCCKPGDGDARDPDTGEWDLSVQRAKFVYEYLVEGGIDKDRMTYAGYGSSHKIFPQELDETQQAQNRRVEIRIVAK